MVFGKRQVQRRLKVILALLIGGGIQLGFVESCDDRLIGATKVFDPCGTVLGNCLPGSFETNAADIPSRCVDPACVIPGACPGSEIPLGTQRELPGC